MARYQRLPLCGGIIRTPACLKKKRKSLEVVFPPALLLSLSIVFWCILNNDNGGLEAAADKDSVLNAMEEQKEV